MVTDRFADAEIAEARALAVAWIDAQVTAIYHRTRREAAELAERVELAYETVRLGHYPPLVASPDLRREAYDRLRELRAALHRFQNALDPQLLQPLARIEQGRKRRAAEDGRGSGPLPLGYRLGALDEERSEKGARGARWVIEREPRGAQIVERIFALHAQHLPPSEIATRLYQAGLGFPTSSARQEWARKIREAERAGQQEQVEMLQQEYLHLASDQFLGRKQVEQVLGHEELYRTGRRVWGGVEARVRWPIILTG